MPPAPSAPWRPDLLAAAGLLWVPHLLPFALESLREHAHCREVYLRHFAVIYALVVTVWRAAGTRGRWTLALLCVAGSTAHALFIVNLLRE